MNTNWNSAIQPCDPVQPWFGVGCDVNGGVANISIPFNDAVGNIPSEIRALTSLGKFDSENCRRYGTSLTVFFFQSDLGYEYELDFHVSSNKLRRNEFPTNNELS